MLNHTTPAGPPTLTAAILAQVEAEIAKLTTIRDFLRAEAAPAVPPKPAPTPATVPAPPKTGKQQKAPRPKSAPPHVAGPLFRDRQTQLARHLLTVGSMRLTDIARFFGIDSQGAARLVKSLWFEKAGGAAPGSAAPWVLSAAGRAVVTRNEPPPGEVRHNPDLDDAFGDLFLGDAAGKPNPVPGFSTNGTGHHANGTTTAEPPAAMPEATTWQVLRLLVQRGPLRFADLNAHLTCNPSTVNKALNALQAKGLAAKGTEDGHRSPWAATAAGRERLARLDQERAGGQDGPAAE